MVRLYGHDTDAFDEFGSATAIDGETVVVGAMGTENEPAGFGAAWFRRSVRVEAYADGSALAAAHTSGDGVFFFRRDTSGAWAEVGAFHPGACQAAPALESMWDISEGADEVRMVTGRDLNDGRGTDAGAAWVFGLGPVAVSGESGPVVGASFGLGAPYPNPVRAASASVPFTLGAAARRRALTRLTPRRRRPRSAVARRGRRARRGPAR